jgi:hypothetical protein
MESLALAVAIIVSPAMYGGPLALLLTMWRRNKISKFRLYSIRILSVLALLSGSFLVIENISRGALLVGLLGISTSLLALWRTK